MNRMKYLICVFLLSVFGSFSFKANAYTERDLLQKAADETTLKNVLVMKQAWVPYPAYTDRAAWDSLMGPNQAAPYRGRREAPRLQMATDPCYRLS